jgi:hypothetical protein
MGTPPLPQCRSRPALERSEEMISLLVTLSEAKSLTGRVSALRFFAPVPGTQNDSMLGRPPGLPSSKAKGLSSSAAKEQEDPRNSGSPLLM